MESKFSVKTNGLEFIVCANDWYNAIQVAYEEYMTSGVGEKLGYMEFRDYCSVKEELN